MVAKSSNAGLSGAEGWDSGRVVSASVLFACLCAGGPYDLSSGACPASRAFVGRKRGIG